MSSSATASTQKTDAGAVKRRQIDLPWSRLASDISLLTRNLSPPEIADEIIARISQIKNPLAPYPARNKDSESQLKAAASKAAGKGDTSGSGTTPTVAEVGAKAGNSLFAQAVTRAAKDAAGGKSDAKKGDEPKLRTALDGEFVVGPLMVANALVISEEFNIDEVESYVLLRSMMYNKGVPIPVDVVEAASANPDKADGGAGKEGENGSSSGVKQLASRTTSRRDLDDYDFAIPKEVLIKTFALFHGEEVLAILKSLTSLCIAYQNTEHPLHNVALDVVPRILGNDNRPGEIDDQAVKQYIERLLRDYSIRSGLEDSDKVAKSEKARGKQAVGRPASSLFKAGSASSEKPPYRSHDVSQILLEQRAILELLFWLLWAGILPWARVAVSILTLAYQCDLGLNVRVPANPDGSGPTNNLLYLEDADKSILKQVEMLWMLLSVSLFDLAHLQSGTMSLSLLPNQPGGSESSDYQRVYDSRLLPQLHSIISSSPSDPRYSPILLGWSFVLYSICQLATEMGDRLPNQYISFMKAIIPDFNVDTISDSTSGIGGWLSSQLAGYAINDLKVLDYLDACIVREESEGTNIFDGEGKGHSVGFGPPIYRTVVKRLVICIPSQLSISLLPIEYRSSYLRLFGNLFGHGPSLPELAATYWQNDVLAEPYREALNLTTELFPLVGTSLPSNGALGPFIRLQRALSGVGHWDLEASKDLSSISRFNSTIVPSPASGRVGAISDGLWGGSVYNNGGIAFLERARDEDRKQAALHVYHYLDVMDSFAMVLPMSLRNLWETSSALSEDGTPTTIYHNLYPFQLPGGSILPVRSGGQLVSGGSGKPLVVRWKHRYSGWCLLLEILDECAKIVNNPASRSSAAHAGQEPVAPNVNVNQLRKGVGKPVNFSLAAVGVDLASSDVEELIVEILDLVRSVLMFADDPSRISLLDSMEERDVIGDSMEEDQPNSVEETKKLELAEVVLRLLSDALSRSSSRAGTLSGAVKVTKETQNSKIISSAILTLSVLARASPNRVWPYMRSTGFLGLTGVGLGFGTSGSSHYNTSGSQSTYFQPSTLPQSSTAAVLISERMTGTYNITFAVISLVRSLLDNALTSDFEAALSRQLQSEVLGNALRFVHTNIWTEYSGWKYRRLGDRFEIGRRIAEMYCDIVGNWATNSERQGSTQGVFKGLADYVLDVFLHQAIPITLSPLIHILTIGQEMATALKASSRALEDAELIWLLQAFLYLLRLLLAHKATSQNSAKQSLLEHQLCVGTSPSSTGSNTRQAKQIPIDSIAKLISNDEMGPNVPSYASEVISLLILSFSKIQPSAPSLVMHMQDAEETTKQLVAIVRDPYQDPRLRRSIWTLMATAVEHQPAFATLFVTGSFYNRLWPEGASDDKGKAKADEVAPAQDEKNVPDTLLRRRSAVSIAVQSASIWDNLWEADPELLCSMLRFIAVVWRHGLEHAAVLDQVRKDAAFWTRIIWILRQRVSSDSPRTGMEVERVGASAFQSTSQQAYHILSQAYVVEILSIEVSSHRARSKGSSAPTTPLSIMGLKSFLQSGTALSQHLKDAATSSFDPSLHSSLAQQFKDSLPDFDLEALQTPFPFSHRHFGPDYLYQITLLESRLPIEAYPREIPRIRQILHTAQAANCNWSLVDAQIEHTRAWKKFVQEGGPTVQGGDAGQEMLFSLSIPLSEIIAKESRRGDIMAVIHVERLGILLALLEGSWSLPLSGDKKLVKSFCDLVRNVHAIVMSETFPPIDSLRQTRAGVGTQYHRLVLRLAYLCSRRARAVCSKQSLLTADQCSIIASAMFSITAFVSVALVETIENARSTQAVEIDRDLELLVTVFEQSTRPELHTSPGLWLERVQELNLARISLELLAKCDIAGVHMDEESWRTLRYPLYARHMLALQASLSSTDGAADTLAMSGAASAYCSISIAPALNVGTLDTYHPALPGDRNPAHTAWCMILTIMTGLVGSVGSRSGHFIETEVVSFIQFYGAQLSRALEWNVGLPLSSAILDELNGVMGLFYAMSLWVNPRSPIDQQAKAILETFSEKSLTLLQHLNYVLSHPNHLASLFEANSSEERRILDRELAQSVGMTSTSDLLDVDKRPFIATLTQKLHGTVRDILSTLVIVNQGDAVIVTEPDDWPTTVQIAPTTKVVVGELATMGTLLEMGNGIVEVMDHFKEKKRAKPPPSTSLQPYESSYDLSLLTQSLESIAIFSVTQLAIWNQQREAGDISQEDVGAEWNDIGYGKDPSAFLGLMALKRTALLPGIGGDVVSELLAMLSKAKSALSKASKPVGNKEKNIIDILEAFLNLRVN